MDKLESKDGNLFDGNLFKGIAETVNRHLGGLRYPTKSAALKLAKRKPPSLSGAELLNALFEKLRVDWDEVVSRGKLPSSENFRWHDPQLNFAERNKSLEVILERKLIVACLNHGCKDWCNQVPLISGLVGPRIHKRTAVDLVRKHGVDEFEFVELKISSDNLLFATIEIVIYGLLWLLSRRDRDRLGYRNKPILDATTLQLSVLAPRTYYPKDQQSDLASEVNSGLVALAKRQGVNMTFRQFAFPADFNWSHDANYSDSELLAALDGRKEV